MLAHKIWFYKFVERIYIFSTGIAYKNLDRTKLELMHASLKSAFTLRESSLVRVGSENDGGYLMLPPFTENAKVISLGIANNIDFEIELIDRGFTRDIFCFDGSISNLPVDRQGLHFESKYIKVTTGNNFRTLSSIMQSIDTQELILKIDIEGDEWEVLDNLSDLELCKFSQIIGEFHGFASIRENYELEKKISLLNRLSLNFFLLNSHPNNWSTFKIIKGIPIVDVLEMTFVNKRIIGNMGDLMTPSQVSSGLNSRCNPASDEHLF